MSTITEYDYLDIRLLVELLQRIVDIGEPLPSIDVISRRSYTRGTYTGSVLYASQMEVIWESERFIL